MFLEATWQAPVGDKAERSPELSPGQEHGVSVNKSLASGNREIFVIWAETFILILL